MDRYIHDKTGSMDDCHDMCPGIDCDTCCKENPDDLGCSNVSVTESYDATNMKINVDIITWICISFLGLSLLILLIYLILKNRIK